MARRIPWGAAATLMGEALSRLSLIAFQFVVANGLGPERYGTMGLVMSYAAVLLPLADAGLLNLALRHLANNPDSRAFPALLGLKLSATAAYLAAVAGAAAFDPARSGHSLALAAAGAYWALSSLGDFLRQCLRAKESSLAEFRARLVQPLLFVPVLALFHLFRPGVTGTLLFWCLPAAGLALAYLVPLRRLYPSLRPRWEGMREALAGRGRFLAQSAGYLLLATLSGRVDLWIIDAGPGREAVGHYFAAYNMVFSGLFFGQALSSHMYPRLHRPGGAPGDRRRALLRAYAAHAGLAMAMLVAVLVAGGPVFSLIFRTPGFSEGAALLPGMGLLLAVSVLNYLWLAMLIGLDRQWIASAGLAGILAAKVLLGSRWVPVDGAVGMVRAGLCAEIPACLAVGLAACWLYLRRPSPAG